MAYSGINIVARTLIHPKIALLFFVFLCASCGSSDDDLKAIWSYEQNQSADPDFQFYPLETKKAGNITVGDSIRILSAALTQSPDSLAQENSRALQSLLQMQSLYVKYDMETLREAISEEVNKLQMAQKWLNKMQVRLEEYKNTDTAKVLIRKVKCRFEYDVPLLKQRITKDKTYFIRTATNHVVAAEDNHSVSNP